MNRTHTLIAGLAVCALMAGCAQQAAAPAAPTDAQRFDAHRVSLFRTGFDFLRAQIRANTHLAKHLATILQTPQRTTRDV